MKTKKFSKKLMLNKKTIVNLENGEMKKVHGGVIKPDSEVHIYGSGCPCIYSSPTKPC